MGKFYDRVINFSEFARGWHRNSARRSVLETIMAIADDPLNLQFWVDI